MAITELASRVQNLVKGSFERENERRFSFCSFGDILLFGNKDRLKVSSRIEDIYWMIVLRGFWSASLL